MRRGLSNVNSIMNGVIKNLKIDRGLKESALKNLWSGVVGKRFKDSSKLVSVIKKGDHDVLLVAVQSSSVSQELFLFKSNILKNISTVANSLGFLPKEIIFSTKLWNEEHEIKDEKFEETLHIFVKKPIESELDNITVPETIVDQIRESIKTQNFSSPEMKDRMMATIIKDLKIQIWRKNNGFPICEKCEIPLNVYKRDEKPLCPSCKYNK